MTPNTLLALLIAGQSLLVALDLHDSRRHRREIRGDDRLAPQTIAFLGGTIVIYGLLQYTGLALAPTGEEMLAAAQRWLLGGRTGDVEAPSATVSLLIGVAAFYMGGFWDYVVHRFVNHSRPLWFTHEYHHLPTRVTVYMPGICVRPLAVVAVVPATAATILTVCLLLRAAGVARADLTGILYGTVLAQVTILGTSHSSFLRRLWWLHGTLRPLGVTTPQEHFLHHACDLAGNYGNFTTLWDRVFGTYLDPLAPSNRGHRAGLAYDQDFLGTLTFGRWKLSPGLRSYFGLGRYCHLESRASGSDTPRQPSKGYDARLAD